MRKNKQMIKMSLLWYITLSPGKAVFGSLVMAILARA